ARKPEPVIVSVMPAPPALALFWDSEAISGAGLLTLKVCAAELPPPGAGLVTVTVAPPVAPRSLAGTLAVRLVLLTKVVVSAAPFQLTTLPLTKFDPVTVRVNAAPPMIPAEGEIELTLGPGLVAFPPPPPLDPAPPQPTRSVASKAAARMPIRSPMCPPPCTSRSCYTNRRRGMVN